MSKTCEDCSGPVFDSFKACYKCREFRDRLRKMLDNRGFYKIMQEELNQNHLVDIVYLLENRHAQAIS